MHLTSAAVKGLPSCHFTPWCSGNVNSVPSSLQRHSVASSGTIDSGVFCGSSCLKMTRLLNTPDIGRLTACVDSSSIDMLAGLSKWPILSVPPDFCANDTSGKVIPAASTPAAASTRRSRFIPTSCSWRGVKDPAAASSLAPLLRALMHDGST